MTFLQTIETLHEEPFLRITGKVEKLVAQTMLKEVISDLKKINVLQDRTWGDMK